jgi:hypothetical protein
MFMYPCTHFEVADPGSNKQHYVILGPIVLANPAPAVVPENVLATSVMTAPGLTRAKVEYQCCP